MWCWLWGQRDAHSRIPDYLIEDEEKKFHFESLPEQPTRGEIRKWEKKYISSFAYFVIYSIANLTEKTTCDELNL